MINSLNKFVASLNLKFLFIALIHFFITTQTDLKVFNQSILVDNGIFYIFIKLIVLAVLILFWQKTSSIIDKVRKKDVKTITFVKYFTLYFSIMLIFFILTYPGIWRFDEFIILSYIKHLNFFYWQHWITSVFYIFCLSIVPYAGGIVFIQISIISLIVAYVISEFHFIFPSKFTWLLLVPLFFPSIIDNNLYPLRLPLYSYLELLFFSLVIFKYLSKTVITYKNLLCWGILGSLISIWRPESGFYIVAIPSLIAILFYNQIKLKQLISLIIILITLSVSIIIIQQDGNADKIYKLSGIVDPLSGILKTDFKSNAKKQDLETINKILNVKILQNQNSNAIFLSKDGFKDTSPQNISALTRVFIKLMIYNFPQFCQQRIEKFVNSNGIIVYNLCMIDKGMRSEIFDKSIRDERAKVFNQIIDENLRTRAINYLEFKNNNNNFSQNTPLFNFFYNPTIGFFMLSVLMIIGAFKRSKLLFFIPALILIQTILTMFTQPANLFMYYLPSYICGYVFFVMFLLGNFVLIKNKQELK